MAEVEVVAVQEEEEAVVVQQDGEEAGAVAAAAEAPVVKAEASKEEVDDESVEEGSTEASTEGTSPEAADGEAEKKKKTKKKFVAQAAPKCTFCGKSVYKTEEVLNSAEDKFHKACLRCKVCKTSLAGRQPIEGDEQTTLSKMQYRVRTEGEAEDVGLFCEKHGNITRGSVVKTAPTRSTLVAAEREKDKELLKDDSLRERKDGIKKDMEVMVGDATPTCVRCGGSLEGLSEKEVVVSGMERFHLKCPENVEEVKRTTKFFIKAADERPVITIKCDDGADTKPLSFLFEVEPLSKDRALRKGRHDVAEVELILDPKAKSKSLRKLGEAHKEHEPSFTLDLRNLSGLSTTDPSDFEHVASVGVALEGSAIRKGKTVFLRLTHTPDAKLYVFASEGDLRDNAKPKSVLVLDRDASDVVDIKEDGPGFSISGFKDSAKRASGEKPETWEFLTKFKFQNTAWIRALEDVVDQLGDPSPEEDLDREVNRVTLRQFKLMGGVLQQFIFTFHYERENPQIGVKDVATIMYSAFPEKTREESIKADPLATLKSDLKQKKEMERVAALGDAPKQAEAGGCCVVM